MQQYEIIAFLDEVVCVRLANRCVPLRDLNWLLLTNTPGTAGGPGGRDRTLAVKSRKLSEKTLFFLKKIKFCQIFFFFCIFFLVMPKYWGEQIFAHGRFPEVTKAEVGEEKKRKD